MLLNGVGGAIVGLIAPIVPPAAVVALVYVIGAWASIAGQLEIAAAVHPRKEIEGEWRLILGGIASVIFGVPIAV